MPGRLSRRQSWPEKRRVAGTTLPNHRHRGPSHSVGDENDALSSCPASRSRVDLDDWDARAKALGGTSNTLAAALTAKLGERMGRRRHRDGAVTVQLVMSERTDGNDSRAMAVSIARVGVDPTRATMDLRDARADIKQALDTRRETPDESLQLASLIPFTPKRTWRRGVEAALSDPDRPVVYSNLGDVGRNSQPYRWHPLRVRLRARDQATCNATVA